MYLSISMRNLLQSRRRSLLLGGALAGVTFLLVVLMGLSNGLSETMVRAATALSAGHVNVAGFYKDKPTSAAPLVTEADKVIEVVREKTPGLVHVIDRHRGWAKVVSPSGSLQSALYGVDIEQETLLGDVIRLAKESEYREGGRDEVLGRVDSLKEDATALLFTSQAKRLGVTVGDPLTVAMETMQGHRNSLDLHVGAVARDIGMNSRWQMLVSKGTVLDLYRLKPDTAGAVMVYVEDIATAPEVMRTLYAELEAAGWRMLKHRSSPFWAKFESVAGEDWVGQKLDLTTWDDEVSFLKWIVTGFDAITYFLIGLLLVIICVGIMNTLWIAVRERTGEVGTLRAIGMRRRQVLALFLTEAVLLALIACGLGATLGAAVSLAINAAQVPVPSEALQVIFMADTFHLSIHATEVVGAVLTFAVVTGLAALGPAVRAARLQPVTAIQRLD